MKNYCLGFAFYNSEVLLIRKARPEFQKGKLNGVGGGVEKNENSLMAMVAEFLEETTVLINSDRWVFHGFLSDAYYNNAKVDIYHTILTDFEYNHLKQIESTNQIFSKDEPLRFVNIHDEIHFLQNRNILMYNILDIIYKLSLVCSKIDSYFKPMTLTWSYKERLMK